MTKELKEYTKEEKDIVVAKLFPTGNIEITVICIQAGGF